MDTTTALLLFGLLTILTLAVEIMFTYATLGFGYGFSSNRPALEKSKLANRISRVYGNQFESAAYIVPVLGAAAILGTTSPGISLATLLVILGRVGFVAAFYSGIPFLRVPFFAVANVSTLYIAVMLLLG